MTISNPGATAIVLQYTSFKQITDDISDARVYGGIHFRTDQDAGGRLGRAVGTAVYKNNLRPMHDDYNSLFVPCGLEISAGRFERKRRCGVIWAFR
jgi:hypothetical protein